MSSAIKVIRHHRLSVLLSFFLLSAAYVAVSQRGGTYGAEEAGEAGRYQTLVVGSQNRLFSVAFLFDTRTGATWRTLIQGNAAEAWRRVQEADRETPADAPGMGRYQMAVSYSSDNKIGQESAGATRVDSATGKSWYLRIDPPHMRWAPVPPERAAGEAKK